MYLGIPEIIASTETKSPGLFASRVILLFPLHFFVMQRDKCHILGLHNLQSPLVNHISLLVLIVEYQSCSYGHTNSGRGDGISIMW